MQIIIEIFTQTDLEDTNDHNTDKGAGILVMIFNEVFEVVCFSVLFSSVGLLYVTEGRTHDRFTN